LGYSAPTPTGGDEFMSVWDTTKISEGSSNSSQVRLPLQSIGTYNFTVEWGDGNSSTIISWNQTAVTHSYYSEGIYKINTTGFIRGWRFAGAGDRLKLLEIVQWGCLQLGNSGNYFAGCENLNLTATDAPDLTGTTTLNSAFKDCAKLGSEGDMNSWDVSNVTDMNYMFDMALSFNQPLGNWEVSNVKTMDFMFAGDLFYPMYSAFNQPIKNWNISNLRSMRLVFFSAGSFNQDISAWDVSNVRDLVEVFMGANSFNQPIGSWNTSNIIDMYGMFWGADSFNQPIGDWDVSNVNIMSYMFEDARSFNQPLGDWDVSNVLDMESMFCMAWAFDQNLGKWNVSNVEDMRSMFFTSGLSTNNYNNLLIGWSQLTLQNGIRFDAYNTKYGMSGFFARQKIIENFNWTINDGGFELLYGYDQVFIDTIFIISVIYVILLLGKKVLKLLNK